MVEDVYMTGKTDDYAVLIAFPNVYIVLENGEVMSATVYSGRMHLILESFCTNQEIYQKVDRLYADFILSVNAMLEEQQRIIKRNISNHLDLIPKKNCVIQALISIGLSN